MGVISNTRRGAKCDVQEASEMFEWAMVCLFGVLGLCAQARAGGIQFRLERGWDGTRAMQGPGTKGRDCLVVRSSVSGCCAAIRPAAVFDAYRGY